MRCDISDNHNAGSGLSRSMKGIFESNLVATSLRVGYYPGPQVCIRKPAFTMSPHLSRAGIDNCPHWFECLSIVKLWLVYVRFDQTAAAIEKLDSAGSQCHTKSSLIFMRRQVDKQVQCLMASISWPSIENRVRNVFSSMVRNQIDRFPEDQ
jgi:hypothetical protein